MLPPAKISRFSILPVGLGFLVLAMNCCLEEVDRRLNEGKIHKSLSKKLKKKIKENVFYGIDAHDGVACSAKMT